MKSRHAAALALCVSAMTVLPAAPAADAPIRASFDCRAARTSAERLICADADLARLDVQAAALYGQARKLASDADALKKEQLAWLRQRDTECAAGAAPADPRQDAKGRACMAAAYRARLFALRDRVAAPLLPSALQAIAPRALQRIGLAQKGCAAVQGAFDDSGRVLAVEVDCGEAGRRAWLVDDAERVVAATPDLGPGDPNGENVRQTGTDLFWDADTLYVFTSMQDPATRDSGAPSWAGARFTATLRNGATRIASVPERIRQFFDRRVGSFQGDDPQALIGDADMLGDSPLALGTRATPGRADADGTAHFTLQNTRAVWLHDAGNDRISLRVKNFEQAGAVTELAHGSFELARTVFDTWHLIYPSHDGLLLHDLDSAITRRIAGTQAGDLPLAWGAASRSLAWISPRPCGGAQGASGQYLCQAKLDGVKRP